MRRLKIVYVIGTLDVGGTERQLVDLVARLDRSRFDPVVLCLASGNELVGRLQRADVRVDIIGLSKPGKRTASLPGHLLGTLARVVRFFRAVRREQPDIVHGMLFWAYTFAAFAARLANRPVVVASRRSLSNFKRGKPHYVWLERVANRLTDVFVANSAAVKRDVLASERISPNRVRIIYNGIDPVLYRAEPDTRLRQSLELSATAPVAIVVANFISYKGHPVFLEAWRQIVDVWPDAVALLVGDGPSRAACEAQVAELKLGPAVRFLGTRHDVPQLLALSTVAVHPSFEEGFSNAVLEAMAAGLPVIATDVGGNSEAIQDGVNGRTVPPGDAQAIFQAFADLLRSPDRASQMGNEGRRMVEEQFSLAVMVGKYEALYDELTRHALSIAQTT